MAEPHSLVRLDAYRSAAGSDVELGPTWWDRHGLSPKADGAENLGGSHDEGPDTARLRSVKADPAPNATQDVDLEAAVQGDKSASAAAGFKEWSTAYVLRLALFDMLIGAMAVAIP